MAVFLGLAFGRGCVPPEGWLQVELSPYKDLSQTLRIAGAQVIEERSSPLGQITVVEKHPYSFPPCAGDESQCSRKSQCPSWAYLSMEMARRC